MIEVLEEYADGEYNEQFGQHYYIRCQNVIYSNLNDLFKEYSSLYLKYFKINNEIFYLPNIIKSYELCEKFYKCDGKSTEYYTCQNFAKAYLNNDLDQDRSLDRIFKISDYDVENVDNLKAGDVVLFDKQRIVSEGNTIRVFKEAYCFRHAAIYIHNDIYLSKLGIWYIVMTSLENLHKIYKTDMIHKISKKMN